MSHAAPPRPAPELRRPYDAIVVGSGMGGSAFTLQLARAGRRVLVIERGTELVPDPQARPHAIGRFMHDVLKPGENAARFLGGQSKFYGAAMYRMRLSDFAATGHEAGTSPAWPFGYDSLEPWYAEAERLYRVHGDAATDPSEPPRSAPFPHPPLPHGQLVAPFVARLQASGTQVSSIPRALDYGPGGKCVLCPTCDAYFCELDARMDAETAALRPAMATGNVELALGGECLQVLTSDDGRRATGVRLRYRGEEHVVHAGRVAVAAGLTGTMELLWRSRTDRHPAGLGNATGQLGRHLGGHWTGMVFPILSWLGVPASHTKTFAITSQYDGLPDWPWPLGVVQVAGQAPYWRVAGALRRLPAWLLARRSLMLFYMTEALPTAESGYPVTAAGIGAKVDPPAAPRTFARAREHAARIVRAAGYPVLARAQAPFLWHETGTARIGDDPATSVCNPDCEVHGVRNLHVVDASALPSAGAVNTALTIVALAMRAGAAAVASD